MVKFVESKSPDMSRVANLLTHCESQNLWANRGPVYQMLVLAYAEHFRLNPEYAITPCSNAGIALEAMARLLALRTGRGLKWVGSAFSFQNLGRGYFADMALIDCDAQGLLDIELLRALPQDSFDGFVVVNPFGLFKDFSAYIQFARETGKFLLIDNAAGVSREIPDWPWQAFSLHHTKPYGMGEGGLALTPADLAEEFYSLLNYGPAPAEPAHWLNNGKISDISCAFLLQRLETVARWETLYFAQAERVFRIASGLGLSPLRPFGPTAPAMSWVYCAPFEIPLERIAAPGKLVFGKYYKPLAALPRTSSLYAHLINIPTHPDVAQLSDVELEQEIARVLA
jgi:dTDP-4-amino-4,6-dideoxygalactose transaminase